MTRHSTRSTDIIETLSRGFEWLAGWIFDHRILVVVGVAALVTTSAVYTAGQRSSMNPDLLCRTTTRR